jgi:hypothetical protein
VNKAPAMPVGLRKEQKMIDIDMCKVLDGLKKQLIFLFNVLLDTSRNPFMAASLHRRKPFIRTTFGDRFLQW